MIDPNSKKIACISDIHLGVHQDSSAWHNISLTFADWLRGELEKRGIKDIVIAGDIFHNRHEIGVSTIHNAYEFFNRLKNFNITAITGNHDCYYKDKSDVNSISILDGYKNIKIIYEPQEHIINGKRFFFSPWGTDIEEIERCDVLFGHFEIVNFRMNTYKICESGIDSCNLLDLTDLVITGHFHTRDCRSYDDKKILYLGSPYELDFSDRGSSKGFTILDAESLDLEFVENTVTPKHKKLELSKINEISLSDLRKTIENNIVSIVVDKKINEQLLSGLIAKLGQYNPLQLRTDFNILNSIQLSANEINKTVIDVDAIMHEFIDLLDVKVDKKDVLNKCLDIYKSSLTFDDNI